MMAALSRYSGLIQRSSLVRQSVFVRIASSSTFTEVQYPTHAETKNKKDTATGLISELAREVGALQRVLETNNYNTAVSRRAFRGFTDRLRGLNAESVEQSFRSTDAEFDVDAALESGISTSTLLALRLQVAEALGKPVYDEPDDAIDFDILATDVSELQFTALSRRFGPTISGRIDLINGYIIFRTASDRYHGRGTGAIAEVLAEAGIRSSEPLAATLDNAIRVPENKALILHMNRWSDASKETPGRLHICPPLPLKWSWTKLSRN
ncbi:hypothetical protein BV898_17413 [Hypsibius exemplaris]|uniref:Uncharacterized protein n=1 Tax=Hypsibius exemplaris TaxID=2072580 RepID=A0A9X6NFJ7_HYPEX|nr:hypothetical protein BV898_17413 [Hypsibius exemplaris]